MTTITAGAFIQVLCPSANCHRPDVNKSPAVATYPGRLEIYQVLPGLAFFSA